MSTVIMLDLDGPLVDCAGDVFERHGVHRGAARMVHTYDGLTDFLASRLHSLNVDPWHQLGTDREFWRNMTQQPWQAELLGHCKSLAPVTICTKPLSYGECAAGKLEWCLDRDLIPTITRDKSMLASPHHLLIDDAHHQVDAFREAGGRAILWPMPWNSRGDLATYGLTRILGEIASEVIEAT